MLFGRGVLLFPVAK